MKKNQDKMKEIKKLINNATNTQLLNLVEVGAVDYDSIGILPIRDVIKNYIDKENSKYRIKLVLMILKENKIFDVKEYYNNKEVINYEIN